MIQFGSEYGSQLYADVPYDIDPNHCVIEIETSTFAEMSGSLPGPYLLDLDEARDLRDELDRAIARAEQQSDSGGEPHR